MATRPTIKRPIPLHPVKLKKIDPKPVTTSNHRIFRVPKHGKKEIEVFLIFPKRVPYRVVKLKTNWLPTHYAGRKIKWLSAFGVQRGRTYVTGVHYTAVFVVPSGKHLLRFEHGKVAAKPHPGTGLMWMDFDSGDPAIGCD